VAYPRIKACALGAVVLLGAGWGLCSAKEQQQDVAVLLVPATRLTTISQDSVGLMKVSVKDAHDSARARGDLVGHVALRDLQAGEPIPKTALAPVPACFSATAPVLDVLVLPLTAPVPSGVTAGVTVRLLASGGTTAPAVFLKEVPPPADAPKGGPVAYAQLLVRANDVAGDIHRQPVGLALTSADC
jgi:hypothetical protein